MPKITLAATFKGSLEVELTKDQIETLVNKYEREGCPFEDCVLDWIEELTGKDYTEELLNTATLYEAEWYE